MDIDFNVDIVKRKIEELESVNRFPSSDEKTKKNFFENWIKFYREDITKLMSMEDRSNDKIETEIASLNNEVDGRIVSLAMARKEKPKACTKALTEKCNVVEAYYARMLSDGDKFTVVGAKEANSKKPETEDFEVETKQDVEYLKAVLAIHAALERKIKLGSSVAQFSEELQKAKKLGLFDETDLEKKIFSV